MTEIQTSAQDHDQSTNELLDRYRSGDSEAIDDLYRIFYPKLVGFLTAKGASVHVAEDVAQITFEKIIKKAHTFEMDNAEGWIFKIAQNTLIDHRRKKINGEQPASDDEYVLDQPVSFDHALAIVEMDWLVDILRRLPAAADGASFADITKLQSYGCKLDEIADIFQVPVGTIKSRIHRGQKMARAIRDQLELVGTV